VERRKQRQSRLAALPSLPPILWHELVNQLSKSEIIFFFDGQRQKFHFLSTYSKNDNEKSIFLIGQRQNEK